MVNAQRILFSLLRKSPLQLSKPIDQCADPRTVASVACILKIHNCRARAAPTQFKGIVNAECIENAVNNLDSFSLSMLLIKRAERQGDPWSGDGGCNGYLVSWILDLVS